MVKKMAIFCVIILMLLSALNIFAVATNDQNTKEEQYSNQLDRSDKESNNVIDAVTSNSKESIEKDKEALDLQKNSNKSKTSDQPVNSIGTGSYKVANGILKEVRKFSWPACTLIIIAGAMIYFILGPRNLARKKYGQMLMFGGFTFFIIAQIAPFLFLLIIQQ